MEGSSEDHLVYKMITNGGVFLPGVPEIPLVDFSTLGRHGTDEIGLWVGAETSSLFTVLCLLPPPSSCPFPRGAAQVQDRTFGAESLISVDETGCARFRDYESIPSYQCWASVPHLQLSRKRK